MADAGLFGDAWEPLSEDEETEVWDRFCQAFAFRPSVHSDKFPGIAEPHRSATWALPPRDVVVASESNLHAKMLAAFRETTPADSMLYALDWQHRCYRFRPHADFDVWMIPVWPDAEYTIFLAPDLSFGTFGHPWEWTLCVFGHGLLTVLDRDPPEVLNDLVRGR